MLPRHIIKAFDKRSYVVKNNLAYTEDDVLVHNIYVYNLPKKCTEEDVLSYFTHFGEVVSVQMKWAAVNIGFVNFKDASSAYTALAHSKHEILRSRIAVKPADSWTQPDADKVLGQTEWYNGDSEEKNEQPDAPNPTSETPSNALTLLSLNDDCLEMICGVLELRDQVNFGRVCPRFNDVFKMFCKRKYKAFDLNKSFDLLEMSSMTLWEIRDFFRFSGEYIQDVTINSIEKNPRKRIKSDQMNQKRITEFIRIFCKNLKHITYIDIGLKPYSLKKLLCGFPKLVKLRLLRCYMNDTTVKSLLHLKNLDTLVISENCVVSGKFLSALSQLKKLSLYGCDNVQTNDLIQICKAMKNLKSLDVRGCAVTSNFFETMADYCLELEVLKISYPHFSLDRLALLPCLKQLELSGRPTFGGTLLTTLLTELGAHKADQLECLKIVASLTVDHFTAISELKQLKIFYCDSSMPIGDEALRKLSKLELLEELVIKAAADITNRALLRLLQNCTRLHLLNIECCKKISTQFIVEAIDMVKSRREESKKPLTIFAYYTSIEEFALAECTEKDVLSYFTQFGEVISVRKKWPTASVHFKDACSAYKALVQPEHQMRGSRIIVDYEEKCEQEVPTNPKSESPSNALTVLSLNDDCLGMICGLLDLRDQINFARVCLRFNDVFKIFCKRKYKAFDLLKMSSMTLCEIRDFFRFFGEYIEEVAINSENKNRNHITEFIGLFCKNLKRITIEDIELQPDALNKLLRSFPKLVELRLLRCYDMNDTTVKSLLHLKNLDTLLLNGCLITDESSQQLELSQSSIEGKFLSGLSQLKKLSLNNCENIKTKNLIKICKAMKNLKSLDMRDCAVTSDFFETMADHCLELEVLKMSFPDFSVDCVARLSCLKHLDLDCSESFGGRLLTTLLTELVAHKADQLESLKCLGSLTVDHFTAISELKQLKIFSNICSLCDDEALRKLSKLELLEELTIRNADDITNEALLGLLQNCTRLHILDIQCCQRISTQFIAEAIDILNKKMIKKF